MLIGFFFGHGKTVVTHRLMPGTGMVRHGVVEHAIHVEEHGFGSESPEAVLLKIFFYVFFEHSVVGYASLARRSLMALLSAS